MNWKYESMEELREYEAKRIAAESIPDEIRQLKSDMAKMGGSSCSSVPVKGGGSQWEDKQINLIVKIEKLKTSLGYARDWVAKVERGLSALSDEERMILDRFYINPVRGNVDRLCDELCLEKSSVYDKKDKALRHYTLARYGCVEI